MNPPTFQATEVRVAAECPRLFWLGRQQRGVSLLVPCTARHIGRLLHGLIHDFFRRVHAATPSPVRLTELAEGDRRAVHGWLTDLCRPPLLDRLARLGQDRRQGPSNELLLAEAWYHLHGLLAEWSDLVVSNRSAFPTAELLRRTFPAAEIPLAGRWELPDGRQVRLVGRPDGLLYSEARRRFVVTEFKTYQAADPIPQQLQLAVYARLIHDATRLPIDGALYRIDEEIDRTEFGFTVLRDVHARLLSRTLSQMLDWLDWRPGGGPVAPALPIEHTMCAWCPQQVRCAEVFGSHWLAPSPRRIGGNGARQAHGNPGGARPTPRPTAAAGSAPAPDPGAALAAEIRGYADQLAEVLLNFGLRALVEPEPCVGLRFIRLRIRPEANTPVQRILRLRSDLGVRLGLDRPPLLQEVAGAVAVDIPRRAPEVAQFSRFADRTHRGSRARLAIGVDLERRLIEARLDDPGSCHLLVGGTTGSGKSVFLRSLAGSLLLQATPAEVGLLLIDTKLLTFGEFLDSPWLRLPLARKHNEAMLVLRWLLREMDQRFLRLEQARVQDLDAFETKTGEPLGRLVCLIDEYQDLLVDPVVGRQLESCVQQLGAKGRAAGLHLVLSTQRPEARVVTPLIRSNLLGRVALRTASGRDSRIILEGESQDAASLLGHGDLLYRGAGPGLLRLQGLLIETADVNRLAPEPAPPAKPGAGR